MRILLIGVTGQLGSDLVRNNRGHEIIAPSRQEMDLSDFSSVSGILAEVQADWVINAAAFHNVPKCEESPEEAFSINCFAVRKLASICRSRNMRFMTFSTDYVFSGDKGSSNSEDDIPRPLQTYGLTKYAGELSAFWAAPEHTFVVRTCGLYGHAGSKSKGGNFIDNRIADGRRGGVLEISCEQIVSPTSTDDLSKAVYQLLQVEKLEPAVYHLVNEGACSWYDLTRATFEHLGIEADLRPVDRKGQSGEMRRPLYSALKNVRARALGVVLPAWEDALFRYLKGRNTIKQES